MNTSEPSRDPRAVAVELSESELSVDLVDGRRIIVPLVWFPRLLRASEAQRQQWRLIGDGTGIHWPEIDEDVSVAGLLAGSRAPDLSRRAS